MSQIQRSGRVVFHDASFTIWEDPEIERSKWDEWERQFKRDVFTRIVQQLNRLGWKCEVPEDYIKQYSLSFARKHRYCRKGDLQGFLDLSGRCIKFEMWQSVNTPTRPDHGGRYESDKEAVMPYLLRLEMERTRRRIRDYLCNVFAGYVFDTKRKDGRNNKKGPGQLTAMEWIQGCYETSWHFKGDWPAYLAANNGMAYNRESADGQQLDHGQRVWFYDHKGRLNTGIAYYNINNMWWVVTGKYSSTNVACFDLYTTCPDNAREKQNQRLRRKRLESELAKAIKSMNFMRAERLKRFIFPEGQAVYLIWSKRNNAYHCSNFSGYTNNAIDAGRFTEEEANRFAGNDDKVIPAEKAA